MSRKVSLFVPCFVDQLLPEVAVDTVKVLRRIGYAVDFPKIRLAAASLPSTPDTGTRRGRVQNISCEFSRHAEVIVCPSGSCATMVRTFYADLLASSSLREDALAVASRTFELSEFLVKVAGVTEVGASFPSHALPITLPATGCASFTCATSLCSFCAQVEGLKLIEMARSEECCGFGGTFAAKFADISAAMGTSKAESVAATEAEFVTAIDPSCLLHVQGILGKRHAPTRTIHLASILAQDGSAQKAQVRP